MTEPRLAPDAEGISPISAKLLERCRAILGDLPRSGRLLVALSGGADSVALLRLLLMDRREVMAAHCNFHLRGEESLRDAAFVQSLCRALGVPLHHIDFDTRAHMRSNPGISVEMACRELRHRWFDTFLSSGECIRIATGHNASDNAETLLLNLLRGSGTGGLKGMLPDDGRVVRPLLETSRPELLRFLQDLGQDYVTDSTNLESDYRRNFLRNDIFPLLRSRWEGTDTALLRSLRHLRGEHRIVRAAISQALSGLTDLLPWERVNAFPDPPTLLHHFLLPYHAPSAIGEEIASLLPSPHPGRHWEWSGHMAVAERDGLRIMTREEVPRPIRLNWELIPLTGPDRHIVIDEIRHTKSHDTAWLPLPESRYHLRAPLPGERFDCLGMKGSRLISDIIAEAHLPSQERMVVKVLASAPEERFPQGRPVWIPGLKRSRHHLADLDHATEIYRVRILP